MVSLELVLDFLADGGIRATYGAVNVAMGRKKGEERNLRREPQFQSRDPRTGWVVLADTRQPPLDIHSPRPDDSELITDGNDLAHRAAEHARRGSAPAISADGRSGAGDDDVSEEDQNDAVAGDSEAVAGAIQGVVDIVLMLVAVLDDDAAPGITDKLIEALKDSDAGAVGDSFGAARTRTRAVFRDRLENLSDRS